MPGAPEPRPAIQTVGLVVKPRASSAVEVAAALAANLRQRGRNVLCEAAFAEDLAPAGAQGAEAEQLAEQADLLVVLGGDGTLIHAADVVRRTERQVPILGVNLGSLGFMTEVPVTDLYPVLDATLAGDYRVERRMKLTVELERQGQRILTGEVLNDAVINKGALARIADLECRVEGRRVTTYKADGVIVATPTGSTAYSLSANGPIAMPTLEAILITPICPHTLTQRPIVIPDLFEVELVLTSDNGEVFLTLDGHTGQPMQQGDKLRVRRSIRPILLVKNPRLDFFALLRAKLRWGER
jgi:NAD+ kinase